MTGKGIDVSVWQGEVDWKRVAADGVRFAMIRAAYSDREPDQRFLQNITGAAAAGVDCGVYLYALASTPEEARAEARYLLRLIAPYRITYPVAYDVEEPSVYNRMSGAEISAVTSAFCDEIQNGGYYAMLYSSTSRLNTVFNNETIRKYDVWAAQWAPRCTCLLPYGIWQYSAKGRVDGIDTDVDLDYSYKDYPSILRGAGLNHLDGGDTEAEPGGEPPEQKPDASLQEKLARIRAAFEEVRVAADKFAEILGKDQEE